MEDAKEYRQTQSGNTRMNDAKSEVVETTPCRKPVTLTTKPTPKTIVSKLVPTSASNRGIFEGQGGSMDALGAICKRVKRESRRTGRRSYKFYL